MHQSTSFGFFIGGAMGPSFRLNLSNGILYCEQMGTFYSDSQKQSVARIIDNPKWEKMLHYLATRKWKSNYEDQNVMDGTQWKIVVRTNEIRMCSSGSNAYPPGFRTFLKLLNDVVEVHGLEIG